MSAKSREHVGAGSTLLMPDAVSELRRRLTGAVVCPGDADYESVRRVWNGSIDRHPSVIARCETVGDVVNAVHLVGRTGMPLAVRGGGHSVAGFGTCDGGVVIDLSPMKAVTVNPRTRTARAGGGATWGDLDAATHAFGLATTGGQVSTTGIGGLTLGGGIGWLVRKYGLACDNLISAEVVLADGSVVTADADHNADLFWGLRGGGANFGVVTSFEYRLHPISSVFAGAVVYPRSRSRDVLELFRDFTADVADEVSSVVGFWTPEQGTIPQRPVDAGQVVGIAACYCGPVELGTTVMRPIREFGPALGDDMRTMPYPTLQRLLDPGAPAGMQNYSKGEYLSHLSDEAIDVITQAAASIPSPLSQIFVVHLGGAVSRVPDGATAFGHRSAPYVINILAIWTDPAERDEHVAWARGLWTSLQGASTGGVYVNFLGDEGPNRVRAAYGPAIYERLVRLKHEYDPTNLFRLNQNVPPGSAVRSS